MCAGLNAVNWASFLKEAPEHAKNELVKNIREGVVIKLEKPLKRCRHNNLPSVRGRINSDFIDKYINEECEKGRILGPFENIDFWEGENIHIVPLGVVSGRKLRMIENYSFPKSGGSVNDAINDNEKSISYPDLLDLLSHEPLQVRF